MLTLNLLNVDSTSGFLANFLKHYKSLKPVTCVAKQQTNGYGQYGRRWESSSSSLTFTVAIPLRDNVVEGWFSFIVACTIRELMVEHSQQFLTVKWPNDIYNAEGKVCGCIIEVIKNFNGDKFLSIGIGINTSLMQQGLGCKASFVSMDKQDVFLSKLTKQLTNNYLFQKTVFVHYLNLLPEIDFFTVGQSVIVYDCDLELPGVYLGLNHDGFPLVEIEGLKKLFNSGRTSIRPA